MACAGVYVQMQTHECRYLQNPEEGSVSPGPGVTGCCELSYIDAGTTQAFCIRSVEPSLQFDARMSILFEFCFGPK